MARDIEFRHPCGCSFLLLAAFITTIILWSLLSSPVASFEIKPVARSGRTSNSSPRSIGDGDYWFSFTLLSARIVATTSTGTTRKKFKSNRWFPKVVTYDDDIFSEDSKAIAEFEQDVVVLTANLIRSRLSLQNFPSTNMLGDEEIKQFQTAIPIVPDADRERIKELVKGRFMDLTCTLSGEDALERLFFDNDQIVRDIWMNATKTTKSMTDVQKDDVIRGAVIILQSLCVMGTQVGVKGPPEQLKRMVEHLADQKKAPSSDQLLDVYEWTKDSVRRLKHKLDRTAALQLLAELRWKQTPQGAFDLLVALGVWEKHEDLALLRSGFPLRFTDKEESVASDVLRKALDCVHHLDPDSLLGIRQDLRHLKVYTIDGASASEIDDGISIEKLHGGINENDDRLSVARHRIWVHIADAESWAPPHSALFEAARRRVTSLYLPNGTISMFPSRIGKDLMSLKTNEDNRALSLGVELNDDGSLIKSSIILTPSLIRVSYRLTYDEVDEMLEEGIAYNEEWEIGALLMAASKRREFRISNGSAEGLIPNPVPSSSVSIYPDVNAPDSIGISLNIEVSHNAAMNKTASAQVAGDILCASTLEDPVSSAYLLVTETMILAGEAIGIWKSVQDEKRQECNFDNFLRLPFRGQRRPDFQGRSLERIVMTNLLETSAGKGLCHAWYSRRFLESVSISQVPVPHSGLGLECYVQWTSPIRRFSDLQVHASIKRFLRRRRVYELILREEPIPEGVSTLDLGISPVLFQQGLLANASITSNDLDNDLDYLEGLGLIAAGKKLQRLSQQYWLFEYIRRLKDANPDTTFTVVVLGCVDPEKHQFAIYVKELGLEHRYTSPAGRLEAGAEFRVKVDNVVPRSGLLSFVRMI